MHIVNRRPLIVVDGGHNPGAAKSLKEALLQYFKPAEAILVIGCSNDKDIAGIVRELAPLFNRVIATRAANPRSTQPAVLAAEFARYGTNTRVAEDIPQALQEARAIAGEKDLICITGSLFVVGEALENIKGYQ
jgi:dihydrofolate synthase/folylpolyglutamate synthase